jgi:hypothetical protein
MTRTKRRWKPRSLSGRSASLLAYDHAAVRENRTVYPSTVQIPIRSRDGKWVLKRGANNPKIGGESLKGKWKGLPIFTLTLEERTTCPVSCHHWRSCYGNHMQWSTRFEAGYSLEWRLEREVALLSIEHPNFAVRLHILGDFYSVEYVELWRSLIERYPGLHCFGFTARQKEDPIGKALASLVADHWERFAIRLSNAPEDSETPSTISIEHEGQKPPDAIVCPQQLEQTESCATCALCWQSRRRVAFLQH